MALFVQQPRFFHRSSRVSVMAAFKSCLFAELNSRRARLGWVVMGIGMFSGGCTLPDLPPSESQSAEQNSEQTTTHTDGEVKSSESGTNETGIEELCESLKSSIDPASPGAWKVRNLTATPIWLRTKTCDMVPNFLLRKDGFEQPWYSFAASDCEPYLCEGFIAAGDCGRGCDDCDIGRAIRINPGDTYDQPWPGLIYEQLPLIPECVDGSDKCDIDCLRREPANLGVYDLSIVAYHACEGDCECPVGLTSPCLLANSDAAKLDQPSTLETSFPYPDQVVVEVLASDELR